MTCPFLEYRGGDESRSFETARAYCAVVDEFVQPMRADVCNDRYDLEHATDCEFYLAAAGDDGATEVDGGATGDHGATEAGGGTAGTAGRPTEGDGGTASGG